MRDTQRRNLPAAKGQSRGKSRRLSAGSETVDTLRQNLPFRDTIPISVYATSPCRRWDVIRSEASSALNSKKTKSHPRTTHTLFDGSIREGAQPDTRQTPFVAVPHPETTAQHNPSSKHKRQQKRSTVKETSAHTNAQNLSTSPQCERQRKATGGKRAPRETRGRTHLSFLSRSRYSRSMRLSMRDLITVGEGTNRLDSCLVTSATRSLCLKVFRAFMMRTTAASVRCLVKQMYVKKKVATE